MSTLQIKLKALRVPQNGRNSSVPALLTTVLVYPRPGFPIIAALRDLGHIGKEGCAVDFTGTHSWPTKPFTWPELLLFKEEFVGQAYLSVKVAINTSKSAKFLNGLVKGLFGADASTLGSPYAAVATGSLIEKLFGDGDGDDEYDDSIPIAAGGVVIDPANIVSPVAIPLNVPASLYGTPLERGLPNGTLEVFVEQI